MEEEPGGLQPMGQEESDVTGHAHTLESRATHASFPPAPHSAHFTDIY